MANSEAFSYDHIGNRLIATRGGATIGAAGSTTKYSIYTSATQTGSITGYTPTYDNRLSAIHIGSITGTLDTGFTFDNRGPASPAERQHAENNRLGCEKPDLAHLKPVGKLRKPISTTR